MISVAEESARRQAQEAELAELRDHARTLEEEVTSLRRKLADAPKRVRTLEERLLEAKGQLAQAVSQNEKLSYTLREAREHIAALREEVDKLTQPPSAYGVVVGKNDDGTVDVLSSGRKMRVALHPEIDVEELQRGQEVVLNESFNVILARRPDVAGEVVTLKEVMEDGVRAMVVGRADEERVCELSDDLRGVRLRSGDTLLMDVRSGLLLERLPRPEVEDLLLEEVPDITYADVGGLDEQIEADRRRRRAALPVPGAVRRAPPAGAQGHPALRPAGLRQDAHRQGRRQLAGPEGRRHDGRGQGPQLLHQHQGPGAAQQVRRRDRAPDPPGVPAGQGEERGGLAGHRVLRRDGLDVPHAWLGHLLRHGVDDRAAAAGRDRRRRGPEERHRDRRHQP